MNERSDGTSLNRERREMLELFEQLHPKDQLDRLIFLLEMPKAHQPPPSLNIAQRENHILDYYVGIPNGLQKLAEALRHLIKKQGDSGEQLEKKPGFLMRPKKAEMMLWNSILTDLRNALASLYPLKEDSVRIVDETGLPREYVQFADKAINNWHNILEEAKKRDKIGLLIKVALKDYPRNEILALAHHQESLTIKLVHEDSVERTEAAQQLGYLKDPAAISILERRWSQEPDPWVRYWLAIALRDIGGEKAIEALHRIRVNELDQLALIGIEEALKVATEQAR